MTTLTISLTAIAACETVILAACIAAVSRASKAIERLQRKLKEQDFMLDRCVEDRCDPKAAYVTQTDFCGTCRVMRKSHAAPNYPTLIKEFSDEDSDFNRREAEELCETLNQ